MPTDKQNKSTLLYAGLMEEAKIRLNCIDRTLLDALNVPGAVKREYCFFHLRMLCEVIALGCLVAHGDIEATTRLRKEYAADKIVNILEELHPDFYPLPVEIQKTMQGIHLETITTGYLTKAELVSLYVKCGDILHRGNLKKLLSPKTPIQTNFPDIVNWSKKIRRLLFEHRILLFDRKVIVCQLIRPKDGLVQVAFGEVPESQQP